MSTVIPDHAAHDPQTARTTGPPGVVVTQPTTRGRAWAGFALARPYLYILPSLLVMGVFIYWPLIQTFYNSFHQWNMIAPRTPVGWDNYQRLIESGELRLILTQSAAYVVLALIGTFLFPVGLALLTVQVSRKSIAVYQSLLFTPAVISTTVGAVLWQFLYLPRGGPLNALLGTFGMSGINWLNDPNIALPAVSLVTTWKFLGFNYLIALAGVSALPRDPLEAARIDGATGWPLLKDIIIPLLSPTLLFIGLTTILQALPNTFVPIQLLTVGGPSDRTTNLLYEVYRDALRYFQVGVASAEAVILVLILGGFAIWQFRLLERRMEYDR